MNVINLKHALIGILLLLSAFAGIAMKPTKHLNSLRHEINLESSIPKVFNEWRVTDLNAQVLVNPQVADQLKRLYSQSVSRSYVNPKGEIVMLSIVYGGDQGRDTQVHSPEACYQAQGFQISGRSNGMLKTKYGMVPIRKLVATMGNRVEPITYWVNLGGVGSVDRTGFKIARLKMGLTGVIPDGILFRVSTISNETNAHLLLENFIKDLLASIPPDGAKQLLYNTQ